MTTQGEIRQVSAQVSHLIATKDREGKPQWEVHVRWPWTPANNRGGDRTYVYREDFPEWDADTEGAFNLEVQAGGCKRNRDGEYYDGSKDWMWNWRILRLLDHAPAPAAPAASGNGYSQPQDRSDIDRRIAWNSAVNNAVALIAPTIDEVDRLLTDQHMYMQYIHGIAADLYRIITSGPPGAAPEKPSETSTQSHTAAPQAPDPSATPEPGQAPRCEDHDTQFDRRGASKGTEPVLFHDCGAGQICVQGRGVLDRPRHSSYAFTTEG